MSQHWTSHQELAGGEVPVSRREQPEERLTRLELVKTATAHRRVVKTFCVFLAWGMSYVPILLLLIVTGLLGREGTGMTFTIFFFSVLLVISLCLAVLVLQLASLVHPDRGVGVLYALAFLFAPPLGAIAVFSLCTEAKKILKRHRVKIGFFGADPKTIMAE